MQADETFVVDVVGAGFSVVVGLAIDVVVLLALVVEVLEDVFELQAASPRERATREMGSILFMSRTYCLDERRRWSHASS